MWATIHLLQHEVLVSDTTELMTFNTVFFTNENSWVVTDTEVFAFPYSITCCGYVMCLSHEGESSCWWSDDDLRRWQNCIYLFILAFFVAAVLPDSVEIRHLFNIILHFIASYTSSSDCLVCTQVWKVIKLLLRTNLKVKWCVCLCVSVSATPAQRKEIVYIWFIVEIVNCLFVEYRRQIHELFRLNPNV